MIEEQPAKELLCERSIKVCEAKFASILRLKLGSLLDGMDSIKFTGIKESHKY